MAPQRDRGGSNNNTTAGSKQGKGGGREGGRDGGGAISMSVPPRPASSPPHPNSSGNKKQPRGQGTTTPIGHPKSKQVIRIEKLLKALHESPSSSGGEAKDPKGGCFCLARDHPLSNYTPICRTCGLILCSMNLPQHACPFCSGALLSPEEKRSLVASLEKQIEDIQAREKEERQREAQQAKRAAGEFPTLLASMGTKQPSQVPGGPHKVLSVKSVARGKSKVVVSSSSYSSTPVGSRPASRGPDQEEEQAPRVPHPGREPKYADRVVDPERPYENLLLARA